MARGPGETRVQKQNVHDKSSPSRESIQQPLSSISIDRLATWRPRQTDLVAGVEMEAQQAERAERRTKRQDGEAQQGGGNARLSRPRGSFGQQYCGAKGGGYDGNSVPNGEQKPHS
jgi:hypothetical protein